MRRIAILGLVGLAAATGGCGSSSRRATTTAGQGLPPVRATAEQAAARTRAAGTARFTLTIRGSLGGIDVSANENGAVSFVDPQAHIYKLPLSGGMPQEEIVDGPFVYTNGGVEAAMNDPTQKPWTKLDTRRLTGKQRSGGTGELAHVQAAAFLIDGVDPAAAFLPLAGGAQLRAVVDPKRLANRVPSGIRDAILAAVANDYEATAFPAEFWLDAKGRIRRVLVSYRTQGGGTITIDARYSAFGRPVDLRLPPAREIVDITPRTG